MGQKEVTEEGFVGHELFLFCGADALCHNVLRNRERFGNG